MQSAPTPVGELEFPHWSASFPTSPGVSFPTNEATSPPALTELTTFAPGSLAPDQSPYPLSGLQTATPGPGLPAAWQTPEPGVILPPFTYWTQSGDTLAALAARFGVSPDQINSPQPSRLAGHWAAAHHSQPAWVCRPTRAWHCRTVPSYIHLKPPAFPLMAYITQAGGYLSTYQ